MRRLAQDSAANPPLSTYLTTRLSKPDVEALRRLAVAADRSISAEARRAIRLYVKQSKRRAAA